MSRNLSYTEPVPLEAGKTAARRTSGMQQQQQQLPKGSALKVRVKGPSNFEVFNACVNDLTGKDKLAKVVLYAIRLLTTVHKVHGLGNPAVARWVRSARVMEKKTLDSENSFVLNASSPALSDENTVLDSSAFGSVLQVLAKLLLLSSNALSATKLERGLLVCLAFVVEKLSGLMAGLSVYRHLMRAGTIPFRVWKFSNHIRHSLRLLLDRSKLDGPATRVQRVLHYWTTKDMISQMANFWYAISDELMLVFRFNILLDGKHGGGRFTSALYRWAEDQELYSWMATILLGLNNDWNKWILLKDEQSRIILNQKVRARTRRIVGDLKRNNRLAHARDLDTDEVDYDEEKDAGGDLALSYVDQLDQNGKNITTVQINAARLTCDLVFDAQCIFEWNMYKPFYVSLGLLSGSLGLYNLWRDQKERLTKKAVLVAVEAEAAIEAEAIVADANP